LPLQSTSGEILLPLNPAYVLCTAKLSHL
jgi:hypothetical protein